MGDPYTTPATRQVISCRPMIRDRRAILALLTALNFLNYIDRAVLAAVLKPMKTELDLSNLQSGLLSSAFLVTFFLTSPWFGARADSGARKGMITLGVVIWSIATLASGLADTFPQLVLARMVVGLGEASFTTLAPTIIDDVTPDGKKGRAFAIFFVAIPAGYAVGYILGGVFTAHWGWRSAFYLTGGPGVIIALSVLAIKEPARKLSEAKAKLSDGLALVFRIPLFRRVVLGYTAWAAAASAFSYWAPSFLLDKFPGELTQQSANTQFGIVLLASGILGTFLGGLWMDRRARRLPAPAADAPYDDPTHKAHVNSMLRVCAIGMVICAPVTALAFLVSSPGAFRIIGFISQTALFLSTAPVSAAGLRSVPPERRASSVAALIFVIHLCGDLWSAALLGLLLDYLPSEIAMMSLALTFGLSAWCWWPRRREAESPSTSTGAGLPQARIHSS